jgi:hypothetical protein
VNTNQPISSVIGFVRVDLGTMSTKCSHLSVEVVVGQPRQNADTCRT